MNSSPNMPYISYKYLEAKSPKELEIAMLKIQVKTSEIPNFTPPIYANGKWITWYLYDYSQDVKPKDKFDMENK